MARPVLRMFLQAASMLACLEFVMTGKMAKMIPQNPNKALSPGWCWESGMTFDQCCSGAPVHSSCNFLRGVLGYEVCCKYASVVLAEGEDDLVIQLQEFLRKFMLRLAGQLHGLASAAGAALTHSTGTRPVTDGESDEHWEELSWPLGQWAWHGTNDHATIMAYATELVEKAAGFIAWWIDDLRLQNGLTAGKDVDVPCSDSQASGAEQSSHCPKLDLELLPHYAMQLVEAGKTIEHLQMNVVSVAEFAVLPDNPRRLWNACGILKISDVISEECYDVTSELEHVQGLKVFHDEVVRIAWNRIYTSANVTAELVRERFLAKTHAVADRGDLVPLDIMILITGQFGWNAMSTLNSLAYHSEKPLSIRLHVVGDSQGIASLQQALASGLPGQCFSSISYYNAFEHEEFLNRLNTMPFACIWRHTFGQLTWARFLFPDLLPGYVDHVIVMCIGDVVVLGDPWSELLPLFDTFSNEELFGIWKPLGESSLFQPGLVLIDVQKVRRSSFAQEFVDAALDGVRKFPGTFCKTVEVDVINHFSTLNPGKVRTISGMPEWHYIPHRNWGIRTWRQKYIPVGLLSVDRWIHYCPTYVERIAWNFLERNWMLGLRRVDHIEAMLDELLSESRLENTEEYRSLCGRPVKLVHMPGRVKTLPFAEWLLGWWSQVSANSSWSAANLRTSKGQVAEEPALGQTQVAFAKQTFNISNHFVEGVGGGV